MNLEKPSISLMSPHSMVIYSPDKMSIPKGSSLTISCSTHSRYSNGVFYLTELKKNVTKVQQSFGHTVFYLAYFEFLEIDFEQQGEYACIYGVNISSVPFCSIPSKSLQVTVTCKTLIRRIISYNSLFTTVITYFLSFCLNSSDLLISTATSSSSAVAGIVSVLVVLLVLLVIGYFVWRKKWRGAGKTLIYLITTVPSLIFILIMDYSIYSEVFQHLF